jgi:hypothetical protein
MNNPVFRIEMPDRMERWAAMISDCLAITLAGLLLSAQNVFHAVLDVGRHGLEARRRLQLKVRLSRPMMAKLEAIGRHCELIRRKAHNLPASVSSLHALAHKPLQSEKMTRMSAIKADEPDAWAAAPIAVTNIPHIEAGSRKIYAT